MSLVELAEIRGVIDDEGRPTETTKAQCKIELKIKDELSRGDEDALENPNFPELLRSAHLDYLESMIMTPLPPGFIRLDASRSWICYWVLQSMALLEGRINSRLADGVINLLKLCEDPSSGGYGGGPQQLAHLAPTYASVLALVIVGTPKAFNSIDRRTVLDFLYKVRQPDGSFLIHIGGEVDVRSVYCAVVVAKILNIYSEDLFKNSIDWILLCQTYEGGFGGGPGQEAHGGYTFCAVAALVILGGFHKCDTKALLRWVANRQMRYEGGFQGRTNKLVDSCYSFWQGATVAMASAALAQRELDAWFFDSKLLQQYVLVCCQTAQGGIADKPGVCCDVLHTCYSLSGMSVAQHQPNDRIEVLGSDKNLTAAVHPAFNVPVDKLILAMNYFQSMENVV